jgi:hypothetical protein
VEAEDRGEACADLKATEHSSRITFGPLRVRRLSLSVWLPLLTVFSGDSLVFTGAALAVGLGAFVRSILMGVTHRSGQISVVNLLHTAVVRTADIERVYFAHYGVGAIHRLVLRTKDGRCIPANGASFWVWPLVLPIHRPRRYQERVERFLVEAGLEPVFDKEGQ